MINGRNKWNELIKTCYKCRKERRNAELKKSRKIKKDLLESEIGKQHGDYIASEIIDQNPIKIPAWNVEHLKMFLTVCYMQKNGKIKNVISIFPILNMTIHISENVLDFLPLSG